MKKALIFALVIGLIAGAMAAPATAKKKKKKPVKVERTFEVAYAFPSAIGVGAGGCLGCPTAPTGVGEKYATIEVLDETLPTGAAEFSWDSNGDGVDDAGFTVCGATDGPVEVPEATEIDVFPWPTTPDCPGGGATSGTIKITYSNMP